MTLSYVAIAESSYDRPEGGVFLVNIGVDGAGGRHGNRRKVFAGAARLARVVVS